MTNLQGGSSMKFRILSALAAVFMLAACGSADSDGDMDGRSALQKEFASAAGNDRVFFGFDRYDLTSEARATLDRQAAWLVSNERASVRVTVEGHTDDRGTREYNLALGERRANSIQRYLTAKGVAASRIQTISYGKERPEVLGSGEAVWAQNRRGVTLVAE